MVQGCFVKGDKKKSTEVEFNPKNGKISRNDFTVDCGSPGAIGLIC
jgi:RNA 3'-terminal phosphate cyclase